MRILSLTSAALCLAIFSSYNNARADLLVNGGFDTFATSGPGITSGNSGESPFGPYYTYVGGTAGLTGWTVLGPSIDINSSTYWQPAPNSTASLDLVGTTTTSTPQLGGVSQTITGLTVGQSYKLDFWHSVNPSNGPFLEASRPKILDVAALDDQNASVGLIVSGGGLIVANGHVQYTMSVGTRTLTNMQWVEDNLTFTAPSSTMTFQFSSVVNPNPALTPILAGPALDDVTLTAVPEPASLVMLSLGGLLLLKRRSKLTSQPA